MASILWLVNEMAKVITSYLTGCESYSIGDDDDDCSDA